MRDKYEYVLKDITDSNWWSNAKDSLERAEAQKAEAHRNALRDIPIFEKDTSEERLTFDMSVEDFMNLLDIDHYHTKIIELKNIESKLIELISENNTNSSEYMNLVFKQESLISEIINSSKGASNMDFFNYGGYFSINDTANACIKATLIKLLKYNINKMSPEVEHKLLSICPSIVTVIDPESITHEGKLILVGKDPYKINLLKNPDSDIQITAYITAKNWNIINYIDNPCDIVIDRAATDALISGVRRIQEAMPKHNNVLDSYDKQWLKDTRGCFENLKHLESVEKLLEEIDTTLLLSEMKDFEDK